MLDICRSKLERASIKSDKVKLGLGDISDFRLDYRFDLAIAPFRVFQNLETDEEVQGLFRSVRTHLTEDGSCILTAFMPKYDRERLFEVWSNTDEVFNWEVEIDGRKLTRHHRNIGFDVDRLIVYPELIYRLYEDGDLADEAVLPIAMRCYYPEEFLGIAEQNGFRVTAKWGGYAGETFGEGPELIMEVRP